MSPATRELIDTLVADDRAVRAGELERRIVGALVVGAAITLAIVVGRMGLRPDLAVAVDGISFWMKSAYTVALAALAYIAAASLAHPERSRVSVVALLSIPFATLAAIAVFQLALIPRAEWAHAALGFSWRGCTISIVMLALPLLVALTAAYRRFAPVHLRSAGTAVGALSGAIAAALYALHCPETSPLFVAIWYSLGIAVPAVAGRLLGPRLLRW